MENDKLNLLITEYHNFCIGLIKKIPEEFLSDDLLLRKAFRFRDDLETAILELQIKSKEGGKAYYTYEIEQLKLKVKTFEELKSSNGENK